MAKKTPFPRYLIPKDCPWFKYDKHTEEWLFVISSNTLAMRLPLCIRLEGKMYRAPGELYPGSETLIAAVAAMHWDLSADKLRDKLAKNPSTAYQIDEALRKARQCREWLKKAE